MGEGGGGVWEVGLFCEWSWVGELELESGGRVTYRWHSCCISGALDEVGDFGSAGVDSGEGEDIEEEDAAVVEEVAEGFLNEFVVSVGEEGDLFDGIDAVDVGEDEQHG